MSHLTIVQLSLEPIDKEEYINEGTICEDTTFLRKTDYGGLPKEDPQKALEWLKEKIKPIGELDMEARTLTLKSVPEIARYYHDSLELPFFQFLTALREGVCKEFQLRTAIDEVGGLDDLFYINGYCHTAGMFLGDYINGDFHHNHETDLDAPLTFHIGALLDGHY